MLIPNISQFFIFNYNMRKWIMEVHTLVKIAIKGWQYDDWKANFCSCWSGGAWVKTVGGIVHGKVMSAVHHTLLFVNSLLNSSSTWHCTSSCPSTRSSNRCWHWQHLFHTDAGDDCGIHRWWHLRWTLLQQTLRCVFILPLWVHDSWQGLGDESLWWIWWMLLFTLVYSWSYDRCFQQHCPHS